MENKFNLQNNQYTKPYHHLLDLKEKCFFDYISWGLEYYSYVSTVVEVISLKIKNSNNLKKVAEVGCGDGKILNELAMSNSKIQFKGFDLSSDAVQFAKAFSQNMNNLTYHAFDFKDNKQMFDLIFSIETLEHVPENKIKLFLETIYQNLNDNGEFILTVPTTNVKLHPKHYRHYTCNILEKQISNLFKIKEIKYIYNPRSLRTKIVRFLLSNQFFILNYAPFRKWLISYHQKNLRFTTKNKGTHLFAIMKKI